MVYLFKASIKVGAFLISKMGGSENVKQIKEWYYCPSCGQKLLKYAKEAKSKKLYIKCKNCKKEIEIIIE